MGPILRFTNTRAPRIEDWDFQCLDKIEQYALRIEHQLAILEKL